VRVEGVQRDRDTRRDGAAQILALGADDVKDRGGAQIDHDRGSRIEVVGTDGVGDPVGTDLTGLS